MKFPLNQFKVQNHVILLNHTSKSSFDFHYIQPHLLSNAHHPQRFGKLFYFHFYFFSCLHFYSRIATTGCCPPQPQLFMSLVCFTCFFVVTEQLYTFRLCYYTWPPHSHKRNTGLILSVLFALRTSAMSQPQPPTERRQRVPLPPPQPSILISTTTLHMVLQWVFFHHFFLSFYS